MFRVRAMNHRRAEIDADANRRLYGGQQIALTRAELKDAHSRWNQELIKLHQTFAVPAAHHIERTAGARVFLPVSDAGFRVGGLFRMKSQYFSVMAANVLLPRPRDETPRISLWPAGV
jgi:hypothetical protein